MKRNVWTASAVAIAAGCVVGVAAQQSGTETSRAQSGANSATTITINGCVQNAGAGGVGTSGSSAATSTADSSRTANGATTGGSYILTNAMMGSSGSSGSSGTSASGTSSSTSTSGTGASATTDRTGSAAGTTGSATSMRGNTYVLEGHEAELKNHVGHRIEVTGTTDSTSRPASADSNATTASGSNSASASASSGGQHFRVNSIRMISPDCSGSAK